MITEVITILAAGGGVTGGGLFLARWVDSVNANLSELNKSALETHERLSAVEAKLPNGEIKELLHEVRELRMDVRGR